MKIIFFMSKKRESKQPRETFSKRDFTCTCGKEVKKHEAIFYDPELKKAVCLACKPKKVNKVKST